MIDLFPHRATVRRITRTLTNGEFVTTAATFASGLQCRIEERAGEYRNGPTGNVLEFDAVMYSPPTDGTAAVRPARGDETADEIIQTTPATNAAYRVLHVIDPDGFNHHRAVFLKAIP